MKPLATFSVKVKGLRRLTVWVLPTVADVHRLHTKGKRHTGKGGMTNAFYHRRRRRLVFPLLSADLPDLIAHEATHAAMAPIKKHSYIDEEQVATHVGLITAAITSGMKKVRRQQYE